MEDISANELHRWNLKKITAHPQAAETNVGKYVQCSFTDFQKITIIFQFLRVLTICLAEYHKSCIVVGFSWPIGSVSPGFRFGSA
jgi:hypothetical protein